jgi:hypothetical protein
VISKCVCRKCWHLSYETPTGYIEDESFTWTCLESGAFVKIADNPPAGCPYALEHAIMESMNAKS